MLVGCTPDAVAQTSETEPKDTNDGTTGDVPTGGAADAGVGTTSGSTSEVEVTGTTNPTTSGYSSYPDTDGPATQTGTSDDTMSTATTGDLTSATGSTSTGAEEAAPCDPACLAGDCPGIVNVKTLGAVGDGEADDYQALLDIASFASENPGVWLVFPEGTYSIKRYIIADGPEKNDVKNIRFSGLDGVRLIGCNAKIDVKGDFHRSADKKVAEPDFWQSYSTAVIPFLFSDGVGFSLEGFEIDGNADLTTRAPKVIASQSHGIFTTTSSGYTLLDLKVHHISGDGLLLGGVLKTPMTADKDVTVTGVSSGNNGRQGMSVIQVRGLKVSKSQFFDTGLTGGTYGGDSPRAGVDVEPDIAPPNVDVKTGLLEFDDCEFTGNLGSQFTAAHANSTDDVLVKNSYFHKPLDPNSLFIVVALGVMDGEIRDSVIDAGSGAVYPGIGPVPSLTKLTNVTIYSSGDGLVSVGAEPLTIHGSKIIGTHAGYFGEFHMPYIQNSLCDFQQNTIFLPKEAHNGTGWQVTPLLQHVAISSENHFTTDLVPLGGEHFVTSYLDAHVVNDHYDSGTAFRPGINANFDPNVPYSQN